jgi:hypothetical protein
VTVSATSVGISFAKEDLAGGLYFWGSGSVNGVAVKTGGIYRYDFGAPSPSVTPVPTPGGSGQCVGCHAVSPDGARLSFGFDDVDGDDEYGDMGVSVIDTTTGTVVGGSSISPGLQTFTHDHTKLVASTHKTAMNKMLAVFDGNGSTLLASGALPGFQAAQPTFAPDDSALVFVASTSFSTAGDHHFLNGSLFTASFDPSTNIIGPPALLLPSSSSGPNYYYPAFSPTGTFLSFDSAPSGDAYNNPDARVQLLHYPSASGAVPMDLPALNAANGTTNSWPRWSPIVQTYRGHKLLWLTFSSTRDYGLHLTGNAGANCDPPESPPFTPIPPSNLPRILTQNETYDNCSEPQLWMAGVIVDEGPALDASDRSFPAFWLPFQDVTTHNLMAQWAQ